MFAKFVQTKKGTYFLLTIDCNCDMNFYEYDDLVKKRSPTEEELFVMRVDLINQPVLKLKMFDQTKVACFDFDNINFEKGFNPVLSNHKTKEEDAQEQLDKLKVTFITSIKGKSSRLRFCKEEKMLYSPLALAHSSRL